MGVWYSTHATDSNAGCTLLVEVDTDPSGGPPLALLFAASHDILAEVPLGFCWRPASLHGTVDWYEEESLLRVRMQSD